MSGPDERRGTDGGEHPLDVDARFADIIAHFHDGEPAPPRVVDGDDSPAADPGEQGADVQDPAERDDADHPDGPVGTDRAAGATARGPEARPGPEAQRDRFVEDLFAEAEAERAARRARIEAEVDRAVDGADGHHFVPPEPPPFPRPADLPGRLAWTGVLIGPVLLLLCALLWTSVPSWVVGTIVTSIVAGFGYLVWRLPRSGDRDDRGDGAIV